MKKVLSLFMALMMFFMVEFNTFAMMADDSIAPFVYDDGDGDDLEDVSQDNDSSSVPFLCSGWPWLCELHDNVEKCTSDLSACSDDMKWCLKNPSQCLSTSWRPGFMVSTVAILAIGLGTVGLVHFIYGAQINYLRAVNRECEKIFWQIDEAMRQQGLRIQVVNRKG